LPSKEELLRAPPALPVLPAGTPPGTDSNPNPLLPQPFPGRPGLEDLAQNGAHPRAHPAVDKNQGPRVRGAYRGVTAGGSSAPISWQDGANRQVAPRRPHGGGRILSTCTFLRLRGRATGFVPLKTARLDQGWRVFALAIFMLSPLRFDPVNPGEPRAPAYCNRKIKGPREGDPLREPGG
jgi:hypothetical protein